MKKYIVSLLTIILLLTLVGCGNNGEFTDGTQNNNADETSEQKIELDIPIGDKFTIVEATYNDTRLVGNEVVVKLKIKNKTGTTYPVVDFQVYSYDKNGDRVGSHVIDVSEMEAGHSTWTDIITTDMTLDNLNSIKIDHFKIMEWVDDNTVQTVEKIILDPKPVVFLEQMTKEK